MEYIYAQTPSKRRDGESQSQSQSQSQRGLATPRSKKFDPYALIGLTQTPGTPPSRRVVMPRDFEIVDADDDDSHQPPLTPSSAHNKNNKNAKNASQYYYPPNNSFNPHHSSRHFHHPKTNHRTQQYPQHYPGHQHSNMESLAVDGAMGFGASIAKTSKPSARPAASSSYSSYIRPATGFASQSGTSVFDRAATKNGYRADGWPVWADEHSAAAQNGVGPIPRGNDFSSQETSRRASDDEAGEDFDLGAAQFTAQDFETCQGDPEEQMRELLAGAVGDGEEGVDDGDAVVEGFAPTVKLMPHQVRGVRWMRERETGRRNGGILADDMGLGKTVQALARIVDGRHTAAEKKTYKGGTLVICPLAVMEQWAEEVRQKTKPGLLTVSTHQGPRREKLADKLLKFDVVVTTFDVLSSEFGIFEEQQSKPKAVAEVNGDSDDSDVEDGKKKKKTKKKPAAAKRTAPLFDIKWLRIIIDEAQNIKNRNTKASRAAAALKAKYRWCLTGTPIQNNVEELYSLFRFLRARPLDNWQTFKARVASEVKAGRTGVAMKRLQIILKAIMLRRTKTATIDGKPILSLPARNVEVVECEFDDDERAFYAALEQRTSLTFNKFLASGTIMSNYTSVLAMLLRLRQACDHPSLVTNSMAERIADEDTSTADVEDELAGLLSNLGVNGEQKCEICFAVLKDQDSKQCPECAAIAGKTGKGKKIANRLPPSAKTRKMIELLKEVEKRGDGLEKTIIFSQWTSYMNILEPFLKEEDIGYVRYDGTLTNDARMEVLHAIKTDPTKKVILISFKAGSTGLNLTCCNNVILMDMWWNPALEDQAFDRAHRLGQTRDVNIYKLTIGQTVEDRILELQNQKRELADAALSGTALKNTKLTMGEIMRLFQRYTDDD